MKKQKGITLIALIITIVILLILSVVTIQAIQGDGIIVHALKAREDYSESQAKEEVQLALNDLKIPTSIRDIDEVAYLQNKLGEDATSIETTGKGNFIIEYKGYEMIIENYGIVSSQKIKQDIEENVPEQSFDKAAWDATAAPVDAFIWKSDDPTSADYGVVVGYNSKAADSTTLRYPSRCTKIMESATYSNYTQEIEKVELPSTVTIIDTKAFISTSMSNFKALIDITIPNSVTQIGDSAFYGCTSLTNITISNGVTQIGNSTFWGCTGLTNITIPNSVTKIGDASFENCTGLINITIPNSVIQIGNVAFYNCTALENITILNSKINIASAAFSGCTNLTNINIPNGFTGIIYADTFTNTGWYNNHAEGITYIGKVLYKYKGTMPENTTIEIAEGTTNITNSAFSNCTGLTNITIPNSVTYIGNSAFYNCTGLTNITIPNSVTYIGNSAFSGCTALTNITIPDSVTYIGNSAFDNTRWYNNQPNGVVYIGKCLYKYKGTMPTNTTIEIVEGTTGICASAFSSCKNLINITIPNSVTYIGNSAFLSCTGITSVIIPEAVKTIESFAFGGWSSSQTINCRVSSKPSTWDSGWAAAPWSSTPQSNIVFGYTGE